MLFKYKSVFVDFSSWWTSFSCYVRLLDRILVLLLASLMLCNIHPVGAFKPHKGILGGFPYIFHVLMFVPGFFVFLQL